MPKITISMGQALEMSQALSKFLRTNNMPLDLAWEVCQNSAVVDKAVKLLQEREKPIYEAYAERGEQGNVKLDNSGLPALKFLRKADGELDLDANGQPQYDISAFVARREELERLQDCKIKVSLELIPRNLFPATVDPSALKGLLPMIEGYEVGDDCVEFVEDGASPPRIKGVKRAGAAS